MVMEIFSYGLLGFFEQSKSIAATAIRMFQLLEQP
jgi:hypothetical protein